MAKRPIRKFKLAPVIAAAYAIISPVNTATLKISANNQSSYPKFSHKQCAKCIRDQLRELFKESKR